VKEKLHYESRRLEATSASAVSWTDGAPFVIVAVVAAFAVLAFIRRHIGKPLDASAAAEEKQ